MKKRQVMSVLGAIALTLGVSMNLQYALDDYGMDSNTLSTFVLAQTGSWWGSSSGSGGSGSNGQYNNHPFKKKVLCIKTITSGNSTGQSTSVTGGISAGVGGVGASASGSSGNSTGTSSGVTITEQMEGERTFCFASNNYVEICSPFDPCLYM